MKKCTKCNNIYPLDMFYKYPKFKDGLEYKCKLCHKVKAIKYRDKGYYRTDKIKEYHRNRYRRNGNTTYENRKETLLKYASKNRDKVKARTNLTYAIRVGKILKQPCEICKNPKVEAHHYKGYEKQNQLIVKWLCREHHKKIHQTNS